MKTKEQVLAVGSIVISSFVIALLFQYFLGVDGYKAMTLSLLILILGKLYEN